MSHTFLGWSISSGCKKDNEFRYVLLNVLGYFFLAKEEGAA
jgi:hypothetical protein